MINEANLSEEELELQHKKRDWIYIQKNAMLKAEKLGVKQGITQGIEKGLKQSIEQGIEQGVEQTTLNIVRNAHQIGLPLSTIEEISGLPEKQITGLLKADADKQK